MENITCVNCDYYMRTMDQNFCLEQFKIIENIKDCNILLELKTKKSS